ncbi:hypothetical protein KJK41_03655 [Bacillus haikouensis]|nr:hypothetical protein KJK41_03655 [Bacillus haikouensis]
MTMKMKAILSGAVLFLVAGSLAVYWFYFSEPDALPGEKQMVKAINGLLPEAQAGEIQEVIKIDGKHAAAPFISKEGIYGVSTWVWHRHKWKLGTVRTKGEPKIWKVDPEDPSTYRIVWNINPSEKNVDTLNFYYKRDRNYSVSGTRHEYTPSIRMKKEVSFDENPYGVLKLPDDWVAVMEEMADGASDNGVFPLEGIMRQVASGIGWLPLDENGKETFPESAVNGSSYHTGLVEEEHIMIMNLDDVVE